MVVRAGVLALQGAVQAHVDVLDGLGVRPALVRSRGVLAELTHLVVPGGESTTLHHLLSLFEMWEEVPRRVRAGSLAVLGTCAGAILLGRASEERPPRWGLLDAEVRRNAYGRQVDSATRTVRWSPALGGGESRVPFIRAPRFGALGPGVEVLATDGDGEPVAVREGSVWAATFHPELAGEARLHRAFLEGAPGRTAELGAPLGSSGVR